LDAPNAGSTHESFTLEFGQIIPKPFCAAAGELVRVDGPVTLEQDVVVSASGELMSQTRIVGELQVRPFDPATGALGVAQTARVRDHYVTHIGSHVNTVMSTRQQTLSTAGGPSQSLRESLRVSESGADRYDHDEKCAAG